MKPLRADARRNRVRVLEAADAVFAAKGTAASTEEVARQAGVGIGTVFRHFPTKEALLEAVLVDRLSRLADEADAMTAAEDAGTAFFEFFTRVVEQSALKNTYTDVLVEAGIDVKAATGETRRRLRAALGTLLSRAQLAGAVRQDVRVPELMSLMIGVSRAAEHASEDGVRARAMQIVFDGLRG